MSYREVKAFAVSLPLVLAASLAICGDWGPWPMDGFSHDDGGSLVIICNAQTKVRWTLARATSVCNTHVTDTPKMPPFPER